MLSRLGRNGKEKDVVKLSCFPGKFLSGVSRFFVSDGRSSVRSKIGRCRITTLRQNTFYYNSRCGFTLIELLVVVLIIGILAAVALPQYKRSVVKARTATVLGLLKNVAEAQEVYYMHNGQYAPKFSDLDIDLPATCTHIDHANYDTTGRGELAHCDNFFVIDNYAAEGAVNANYCPDHHTNWSDCSGVRELQINFLLEHNKYEWKRNKRWCVPYNGSKLGQSICSSFGGLELHNN